MSSHSTEIGEQAQRFMAWARQMGWVYENMPAILERFERFAKSRAVERIDQIDTALLVDYQRYLRTFLSASTVNHNLWAVRALWRFLNREGLASSDTMAGVYYLPQDNFLPYIYSRPELERIIRTLGENLRQAKTAPKRNAMYAMNTAFGLICDCGLRISEACRLNIRHYRPRLRTLRIERTKYLKTRVIPLPRSTCTSMDNYLKLRRRLTCQDSEEQALFLSAYGRRIHRITLEYEWKLNLENMGIYRARHQQGRTVMGSSNVHSMRHSFAVHRLEAWYRQGVDVGSMLPLLSAYMGHAKVSYTTVYLHLTPLLAQVAKGRFGQLALPYLDRGGFSGQERR